MELCKPVGQFSDTFFKLLVIGNRNENILVSPLSIHIAMSMLLHGARNKLESQLKYALKLQSEDEASYVGDGLKDTPAHIFTFDTCKNSASKWYCYW